MNQTPHDPNSLADELDRLLSPSQGEQAATSSDLLVETALRLSAAPRPALSPDGLARIRASVQAGQMTAPPPARLLSRRFLYQSAPFRLATVATLVLVFVTGAIFAARIGIELLNPPAATPLLPIETMSIVPTTPIPTLLPQVAITNQPPTSIPIEPLQLTPTNQPPTSIPTEPLQSTPTNLPPTPVPTTAEPRVVSPTTAPVNTTPVPTLPVTIVIEGPVQAINVNMITIFDLTIEINLADPTLANIQVGDMVRIEGNLSGDGQVILAINVTLLEGEVEVIVNPADGQVWQDPGNCSNPPPPWAPANGWRRRCEGQNPNTANNDGGDDDDDDEGMGDD